MIYADRLMSIKILTRGQTVILVNPSEEDGVTAKVLVSAAVVIIPFGCKFWYVRGIGIEERHEDRTTDIRYFIR